MPQDQQQSTYKTAGAAAILAHRYAEALLDLAEEQKASDAVAADLRALRNLLRESAPFRTAAHQPRLTRAQLVLLMREVAMQAKLNNLTGNFLALLACNRRLAQLDLIIDAYLGELAARRGESIADVRAARPLSAAQQEQLAQKLRELAGGKVHIDMREDASLLGGLTVKLGSRLIDASVKSKLARLERRLKSSSQLMTSQKGAA